MTLADLIEQINTTPVPMRGFPVYVPAQDYDALRDELQRLLARLGGYPVQSAPGPHKNFRFLGREVRPGR